MYDDLIPSEDQIHKLYNEAENDLREKKARYIRWAEEGQDPSGGGRQAGYRNPSRFSRPSFRSQYFNTGLGLKAIGVGETVNLATLTVPALHAGVLTGFSQQFTGCEEDIINQITWGFRINGFPTQGFADFQGQFSSLALPQKKKIKFQ